MRGLTMNETVGRSHDPSPNPARRIVHLLARESSLHYGAPSISARGLRESERNMPKMKSHKGLKKRVKVSANGKLLFKAPNAGHLMSGKSGSRRRKLRRTSQMSGPTAKRMIEAVSH